jgi:hypothetical protein
MGGMYTLKATDRSFHRAVAFYGMVHIPDHWQGDDHREPLDALSQEGRCPTMAIIGGKRRPSVPEAATTPCASFSL